jgi:hypothetical protein
MKKTISIIMVMIMAISAIIIVPTANAATSAGFEYTINSDGTATIDYYEGKATALTIPDNLAGHTVSEIGPFAFLMAENLKSVTVPASVKKIGASAFCSEKMESILVDSESKYFISVGGVLYNKAKTKLVQYPINKKGTSYTIQTSVTDIGNGGFYGNQYLKKITLPASLKNIGYDAFMYCQSLTSIKIPANVTVISEMAFAVCTSLKTVTMSNKVTKIQNSAFASCTSLTSVTLSEKLKTVEASAFAMCNKLKTVTIPKSVTKIGDNAFGYTVNQKTYEESIIKGFKIKGYNNSAAQKYAKKNKITFVILPNSVKCNPSKITLKVKETYKLNPVLSPSKSKASLKYQSSNTKVAKVNSKGKITAVKKGTATITVTTENGKKTTVKVTVKKK